MLQIILKSLVIVSLAWSALTTIRAATLCAIVQDDAGLPLPRAHISVRGASSVPLGEFTDQEGKACLEVGRGTYAVEVELAGFMSVRYTPVRLEPQRGKNLVFRLPFGDVMADEYGFPESVLSGTLTSGGHPWQRAKICLMSEKESSVLVHCGLTDSFGDYYLSVQPGRYRIEVTDMRGLIHRSALDLSIAGIYRNAVAISSNR